MYTLNLLDFNLLDIKESAVISKEMNNELNINSSINIKNNIYRFHDTLKENISKENLMLFYKNIATLRIKNRVTFSDFISSVINGSYVTGAYNVKENIVYLSSYYGAFNSDLTHELLHMSSAIYDFDNNIDYCGFSQAYNDKKTGYAINEGYTELINKRLFSFGVDNSYQYEVFVCSLIELLLGKENMEKYYFNADLLSVVNELSKYTNRLKVDRFLIRSDYLLSNLNRIHIFPKDIKKVDGAFNYINDFLIDSSFNKEISDIKDGFVSKEEALDNFILFADKISDIKKFNLLMKNEDMCNRVNSNIDKGIKVLKKI